MFGIYFLLTKKTGTHLAMKIDYTHFIICFFFLRKTDC